MASYPQDHTVIPFPAHRPDHGHVLTRIRAAKQQLTALAVAEAIAAVEAEVFDTFCKDCGKDLCTVHAARRDLMGEWRRLLAEIEAAL